MLESRIYRDIYDSVFCRSAERDDGWHDRQKEQRPLAGFSTLRRASCREEWEKEAASVPTSSVFQVYAPSGKRSAASNARRQASAERTPDRACEGGIDIVCSEPLEIHTTSTGVVYSSGNPMVDGSRGPCHE